MIEWLKEAFRIIIFNTVVGAVFYLVLNLFFDIQILNGTIASFIILFFVLGTVSVAGFLVIVFILFSLERLWKK